MAPKDPRDEYQWAQPGSPKHKEGVEKGIIEPGYVGKYAGPTPGPGPVAQPPATETETRYVYVNPQGATLTWTKKPENWNRLVGKKEIVQITYPRGATAAQKVEAARRFIKEGETSYTFRVAEKPTIITKPKPKARPSVKVDITAAITGGRITAELLKRDRYGTVRDIRAPRRITYRPPPSEIRKAYSQEEIQMQRALSAEIMEKKKRVFAPGAPDAPLGIRTAEPYEEAVTKPAEEFLFGTSYPTIGEDPLKTQARDIFRGVLDVVPATTALFTGEAGAQARRLVEAYQTDPEETVRQLTTPSQVRRTAATVGVGFLAGFGVSKILSIGKPTAPKPRVTQYKVKKVSAVELSDILEETATLYKPGIKPGKRAMGLDVILYPREKPKPVAILKEDLMKPSTIILRDTKRASVDLEAAIFKRQIMKREVRPKITEEIRLKPPEVEPFDFFEVGDIFARAYDVKTGRGRAALEMDTRRVTVLRPYKLEKAVPVFKRDPSKPLRNVAQELADAYTRANKEAAAVARIQMARAPTAARAPRGRPRAITKQKPKQVIRPAEEFIYSVEALEEGMEYGVKLGALTGTKQLPGVGSIVRGLSARGLMYDQATRQAYKQRQRQTTRLRQDPMLGVIFGVSAMQMQRQRQRQITTTRMAMRTFQGIFTGAAARPPPPKAPVVPKIPLMPWLLPERKKRKAAPIRGKRPKIVRKSAYLPSLGGIILGLEREYAPKHILTGLVPRGIVKKRR